MFFRSIIVIALCGLLISVTASSSSELKVFESIYQVPPGWTQTDKPSPTRRLRLRIALQMPNHTLFEQAIYDVSTPNHELYGQHLNHEEVRAIVKPRDESIEAVLAWLKSSGLPESDIEHDNEWINFSVSVAVAESMLNTTFHYYAQHAEKSQSKKIRTLHYSVPNNIFDYVAMIEPTTRFDGTRPERNAPFRVERFSDLVTAGARLNATACNTTITPDCLRDLYNIGDYAANPTCGSLFGVCGYLNEYAKFEPLELFLDKYAPYAVGQNFSYVLINGGKDTQYDPTVDDVEANLDIQYAASLGFKENINYYSTGGHGPLVPDLDQPDPNDGQNEPYLDFLTYILKKPNDELPQTITTSYGESEQSVPEQYSRVVCNLFGQLGLRGVSVIFASGDTGVGSGCQTNDGKNTTRFLPVFPASCPYVTSVGGTYRVQPEIAISFSSGGFSDRWQTPKYQSAAVEGYLKKLGNRWEGLYNPQGRGFPDVAAQSNRFRVIEPGNREILVGGTSASAPAFAAIVSLLNNARLSVRQPPLGFLNPWLYSEGKPTFTDITNGGSKGCTGKDVFTGLPAPYVPYASWNATQGWDPVTGLGTPDFKKMLQIVAPYNKLGRIKRP